MLRWRRSLKTSTPIWARRSSACLFTTAYQRPLSKSSIRFSPQPNQPNTKQPKCKDKTITEAKLNRLNLTEKDYERAPSTMCRRCDHDTISASIMHTYFENSINPQKV